MSDNSFGRLFRFTSWGESHGEAIGCVVDGVPPGLALEAEDVQFWLDRRRPGQSRYTTQRREADQVQILSGLYQGHTTGTALSMLIHNQDQRSKDYKRISDQFRPGHADYTYWQKYGLRDPRGGGRASARETAMRVAAGAIARLILARDWGKNFQLRGAMVQMGPHKVNSSHCSWDVIHQNPFWCPDAKAAAYWADYLDEIRRSGSSVGAVVELVASGVPPGLGAPIYGKLDADLAMALMGINAVKGVEIGAGFAAAALNGIENADEMRLASSSEDSLRNPAGEKTTTACVTFLSNQAGGILGGISTGQDIVARFAVKPTSSILTPRRGIDRFGREVEIVTSGRHDPCVGIRAVPVGEAMLACVLADHWLRHKAQCLSSSLSSRSFDPL